MFHSNRGQININLQEKVGENSSKYFILILLIISVHAVLMKI